jgi:uncharacterized protein with NRDE domain
MCLLSFAINSHADYRLIIAANRDEKFARPTSEAKFWDDAPHILAGRDLEAGGTWLGVTNSRLAALTNYYGPDEYATDKLTRGKLITDFLNSNQSANQYLEQLEQTGDRYNGFGLVFGDSTGLNYFTNRGPVVRGIPDGVHALSNHLLDTHWPKVINVKAGLLKIISGSETLDPEDLFTLLSDRTLYADSLLPDTGVGIARERSLSSIFVSREDKKFGTRCSTIILIDQENHVIFIERSFDSLGNIIGTVEFHL